MKAYESVGKILIRREKKHDPGYVTREFQDYGYRLALALEDLEHTSLYIRLAKEEDRRLLEEAKAFALDYPNPRSRAKIFMWRLGELKESGRFSGRG